MRLNRLDSLFTLIKSAITGIPVQNGIALDFKELYSVLKKHDLAHLIYDVASKNNLIEANSKASQIFYREKILAVYRYQQQNHELKIVRGFLQNDGIKYIPLKGSAMREYYLEPWMRTSCDIDILIREEDLKKVEEILLSIGYKTDGKRHYHDISFQKDNINIEVHFSICEAHEQFDDLLSRVWSFADCYDGYEYRETKDFFAFHHIVHMAHHFLSGGCGIRPIIDLWILKNKQAFKENNLRRLLDECHLITFYEQICYLSEVWFGERQHNETTRKMEKYIVEGGVYGIQENGAAIGIAQHNGSKIKYILSIVFLPYDDMCKFYPKLVNHKLLLPFYYIHRFFSKCFGKNARAVRKRSKTINSASKKEVKEFSSLINQLELNH